MRRWPTIVAVTLTMIFVVGFSWFDLGRHWKTNSGRFDLGNVEQTIWNVIHGHGFALTDPYGTVQVSRLAFHADVFLLILVPFYAVFPTTETLLLLQVLVVASGAIAVYLIGQQVFGRQWWGTLFATVYLFTPGVQWATIFDVHAVTFATPLILWAAWLAMRQRYGWTMVMIVLAMTTKEEIGLGLLAIGLYVWLWQRRPRWGIWLTTVPLVWSLAMFFLILPLFHVQSSANGEVYQSVFGNGAASIMLGALKHPLQFLHQLFTHQNLVYGWQLVSASGLFGLLSPWFLAATPEYVINALSLKPAQHLIISHYTSGLTPWLLVSAIVGAWWVSQRLSLRFRNSFVESGLLIWFIGWLTFTVWTTGPLPGTPHSQLKFASWQNPYAQPMREWAKKIPTSASVSVTNNVGAQFAKREQLYSFPQGYETADYVVVLEGHATPVVASQTQVSELISVVRSDPRWEVLEQQGDLTVLRRKR